MTNSDFTDQERILRALANCENCGVALSHSDIALIENDIGRRLPSETALFFLHANGCSAYSGKLYDIDNMRRNLYGDIELPGYEQLKDRFLMVGQNYANEYIIREWDDRSNQYWLIPMIDMDPNEKMELARGLPNLLETLNSEQ